MDPAELAPEPPPPPPPPARGWTYLDVLIVLGFALGAQVAVVLVGLLAAVMIRSAGGGAFSYREAATSAVFVLGVQAAWWVLVFWMVYKIVRVRDGRSFWEAIAWIRPPLPSGVYVSGGVGLALLVAGIAWLIRMPRRRLPIEELFRDPASAFLLAGFGILIAPVVEELLFRGFLFPVMARAHGAAVAVIGTASLFSLVHAQQYGWAWQNLLLLTLVGVVFGTLRAVSGSVVPPVLAHAGYNLTLFAGLYAASNRFQNL